MTNEEFAVLSRNLVDQGKLIEAGWVGLRMAAIAPDAPQIQLDEMRMAFMAGAQHVFNSVIAILDDGSEPTDADMQRMNYINEELIAFAKEFTARMQKQSGRTYN